MKFSIFAVYYLLIINIYYLLIINTFQHHSVDFISNFKVVDSALVLILILDIYYVYTGRFTPKL